MTERPVTGHRLVKAGFVGCGQMGRKHALNCAILDGVKVLAVADTDRSRANDLASQVGARAYDHIDQMMAGDALDCLIVATPPSVRLPIVEAAAARGAAVFVEKPLALGLDEARAICRTVDKAGVVNSAGFHLRYCPLTQKAKTLMAGRRLTHVRTLTTTSYYLKMDMPGWFLQRKHSGGPLLEQSLHMFDVARYLAGDITEVLARGDRLIRPELGQFDSEDTLVLAYGFASGALGTHTDSCAMEEFNWEAEFFGPDWRLLVDYARKKLRGHIGGEPVEMDDPDTDMHLLEMASFVDAVRGQDKAGVLCDFADAARTIAVMLAGDRSLKTGAWEAATM